MNCQMLRSGPPSLTPLSANLWQELITLNTWHQLRVTVSPPFSTNGVVVNETRVYVNGVAQTTNYPAAPNNNSSENWTLHLGDFDGDIDEVRISNIAREP